MSTSREQFVSIQGYNDFIKRALVTMRTTKKVTTDSWIPKNTKSASEFFWREIYINLMNVSSEVENKHSNNKCIPTQHNSDQIESVISDRFGDCSSKYA